MDNYTEYEIHIVPVKLTKDENKRFYSAIYRCGENYDYASAQFEEKREEFDRMSNDDVVYDVSLLEKTVSYTIKG